MSKGIIKSIMSGLFFCVFFLLSSRAVNAAPILNTDIKNISTNMSEYISTNSLLNLFKDDGSSNYSLYSSKWYTGRGYVQFECSKPMSKISLLASPNDRGFEPVKGFTLVGSNDNFQSETVILSDTYSTPGTQQGFDITNYTNFKSYRFYIDSWYSYNELDGQNIIKLLVYNEDSLRLDVNSSDKISVGDEITADVVIYNATNICAEDIRITYDTNLLEYVGAINADGMKIYKEANITSGTIRFITASLGKTNAANGDKTLIYLKFKAKAPGKAKVDIIKGRIADNATLEMDLTDANCGETTINILAIKDVNRTGEYTLLDLGIDAWYYGSAASDTDRTKYDADQDGNEKIDDNDLTLIVNQLLSNTKYPLN